MTNASSMRGFSLDLVPASGAVAEDLVAVVDGREAVALDDVVLEAFDPLLLEFDDGVAGDAAEVVVVGAPDHRLVDFAVVAEVVSVEEVRLLEDGEGVVDDD